MAVAVQTKTTGTTVTSQTAPVFTIPSGTVDGDLLMLIICYDGLNGGTSCTKTGWTIPTGFPLHPTGLDGQSVHILTHIASGEGADTGAFTVSGSLGGFGNDVRWALLRINGHSSAIHDATPVVNVVGTGGNSPLTMSNSGITTVTANTLLLWVGGGDPNTANTGTIAVPSGYTSEYADYSSYAPLAIGWKAQAAAGASGSADGTLTFSGGQAAYATGLFAIRAATTAPSFPRPMARMSAHFR